MRNLFLILILACTAWNTAFAAEKSFKTDKYAEVQAQDIRLSPEKYLLKQVSLKVTFIKFNFQVPGFAEISGIKSDKYLWFCLEPETLHAFILKKDADINLKAGASLTLYGKVLKFNSTSAVRYYLMVEHVLTEDKSNEKSSKDDKKANISGRPSAVKTESPAMSGN